MVFSSTVFLFLFLPGLLLFYYGLTFHKRTLKNLVLLLFSLMFYAWGEPIFVFIMIASVFINYFLALFIKGTYKKFFMILAIILDVGILIVYKYASFLSDIIFDLSGVQLLSEKIPLPIGISFFTFQMMSYIFDIYYEKSQARKNPLDAALYISLFPQLIAGPIVRYGDVEKEIDNRNESMSEFSDGVERYIYGLAKKVLIANFLAQISDNVFGYIQNPSVLLAWLGALAYTGQIYFDFSGYSDMAIGLGLMFGFHFKENFNYPYMAVNVRDFWHRWHISLSTWFRDYVYIPMGGSRVSATRHIFNIFTVWLLTGIWHGANWTFILWGLIYFAFLIFEKAFPKIKSHIYTMLVVIFAWVFFKSESVSDGVKYISSMLGLSGNLFCDFAFLDYVKNTWVVLIFALIGIFPVIPTLKSILEKYKCLWLEKLYLILIALISIAEVVGSSYNPFIYFNF